MSSRERCLHSADPDTPACFLFAQTLFTPTPRGKLMRRNSSVTLHLTVLDLTMCTGFCWEANISSWSKDGDCQQKNQRAIQAAMHLTVHGKFVKG